MGSGIKAQEKDFAKKSRDLNNQCSNFLRGIKIHPIKGASMEDVQAIKRRVDEMTKSVSELNSKAVVVHDQSMAMLNLIRDVLLKETGLRKDIQLEAQILHALKQIMDHLEQIISTGDTRKLNVGELRNQGTQMLHLLSELEETVKHAIEGADTLRVDEEQILRISRILRGEVR